MKQSALRNDTIIYRNESNQLYLISDVLQSLMVHAYNLSI